MSLNLTIACQSTGSIDLKHHVNSWNQSKIILQRLQQMINIPLSTSNPFTGFKSDGSVGHWLKLYFDGISYHVRESNILKDGGFSHFTFDQSLLET